MEQSYIIGSCSIPGKYIININCVHDKFFNNRIVKY